MQNLSLQVNLMNTIKNGSNLKSDTVKTDNLAEAESASAPSSFQNMLSQQVQQVQAKQDSPAPAKAAQPESSSVKEQPAKASANQTTEDSKADDSKANDSKASTEESGSAQTAATQETNAEVAKIKQQKAKEAASKQTAKSGEEAVVTVDPGLSALLLSAQAAQAAKPSDTAKVSQSIAADTTTSTDPNAAALTAQAQAAIAADARPQVALKPVETAAVADRGTKPSTGNDALLLNGNDASAAKSLPVDAFAAEALPPAANTSELASKAVDLKALPELALKGNDFANKLAEMTSPATTSTPAANAALVSNMAQTSYSTAATSELGRSNVIQAYPGKTGWDQAISQKVIWMVGAGEQSATLTLNPPDLGPVQVVINVNNNQADATFISQNSEVRQALQDGMSNLRDKMAEAGIELGQANVNAGQQGQQQAFEQTAQGSRSSSSGFNTQSLVSDNVVPKTTVLRSSNGLVDTFA